MARKARTTLYLDRDLVERAKASGINLSRFIEAVLRDALARLEGALRRLPLAYITLCKTSCKIMRG